MLIPPKQLKDVFLRVKRKVEEFETPVQLFAALNCDSVCAVRIMINLLRIHQIPYELHPVHGYEDIMHLNHTTIVPRHDELHSIFFVGCAGSYDMMELMFGHMEDEEPPDTIALYIVDPQRPYALENVHNQGNVFILDETNGKEAKTYPFPVEDSDDEEENSEDEMAELLEDSEDSGSEAEDGNPRPRKRRRKSNQYDEAKMERRKLRMKVQEYYKYTYWSSDCCSYLFWKMTADLKKGDNNLLWLAILGYTDMYINDRISRNDYDNNLQIYKDAVLMRNDPLPVHQPKIRTHAGAGGLASILNQSSYGGNTTLAMNDTTAIHDSTTINDSSSVITHTTAWEEDTLVRQRKEGHIAASREFHFTLMRHWNLMDAMYHSRYIATKLGVWRGDGMDQLKNLIVSMGIQLNEAKQPYGNMELALKNNLNKTVDKFATDEWLGEEVAFSSFTKQHGLFDAISAADMIRGVDGLLTNDNPEEKAKVGASPEEYLDYLRNCWVANFSDAISALSTANCCILEKGIKLAIERQKDIVHLGTRLIEKNMLKRGDQFWWAIIDHKCKFTSEVLLARLAAFILDTLRELYSNKKQMPLVLACLCDVTNSYIIVGVPNQKTNGRPKKNPFGVAFQTARDKVEARVRHSGFQSYMIEVQCDDVKKFINQLHYELTA